jgi:ABC-type lipoprotein release transport system permease subunit
MASLETRYALRSVRRNARRTLLSVLGIGIGCALALYMESMNRGRDELFARVGATSGSGHVRVVPAGWRARRDTRLRLADGQADLQMARSVPGVAAAAPRARAQVLLAMGTHVVPVEMAGVDAAVEPRAYRFAQKVSRGRYLEPGERGAVVVGKATADRLRSDLDDEIVGTAVGRSGSIESAMFRIVGIVETGSDEIDLSVCQVALEDVEELTGLVGAGEVAVVLDDWRSTEAARARLAPGLARGDEAMTWSELNPEFQGHLEQDKATSRFASGVILLIVFLGVASAQLAAVLERRREFAVLSALGMGAWRMVRLVFAEAVALGLAGAAVGLALGLPFVWRFATHGLDFRRWMGSSYSFQGVIFEPILYGDLGPWVVGYALGVGVGATLLASLHPAWFAARTDPAAALRLAP